MTYTTEIRDGHHIVTMLTDEQIDIFNRLAELVQSVFDRVSEIVNTVFEGVRDIINSLPEETKEEIINDTFRNGQYNRLNKTVGGKKARH